MWLPSGQPVPHPLMDRPYIYHLRISAPAHVAGHRPLYMGRGLPAEIHRSALAGRDPASMMRLRDQR